MRRAALVVVAALLVTPAGATALAVLDATPVAAAEESGASSRVVGRGDILTSIIGWGRRRGGSGGGVAPACRWTTARDAQIEWLVAVSAHLGAHGGPHRVLDSVRDHLVAEELPDGDLQVRICGNEVHGLRFVPRAEPAGTIELLARRMITRLPVPEPRFTPPPSAAVPLHQPVFVSIDPADWREVHNTLHADGVTAEVRAVPVGLRVISGEPAGRLTTCVGPAAPFDPSSILPVRAQAELGQTCAFSYRRAPRADAQGRPGAWIGTVTVLWRAEWRTGDGPWAPLGTIPRTRLFDRTPRELLSSIETPRR
jgi:hypothetical protein